MPRPFGWNLEKAVDEGMLSVQYFASDSIYIDEFGNKLLDEIRRTGAKRVVIDSLNDLETTTAGPEEFRDFAYAIVKHMAKNRVSGFFTYEVADLFRVTSLSPRGVSHMADNVVMFNYVKEDPKVEKIMTVLKTRAGGHDELSRKYEITSDGIVAA